MKRIWIWAIAAAVFFAAGLLPLHGTDVAELVPARVLRISAQGGEVEIEDDNGITGRGRSLDAALSNMQLHADGQMFFGTVEHVAICTDAWYLMPQVTVCESLRPAAKLYRMQEDAGAITDLADYLDAHPADLRLSDARAALLAGQAVLAPRVQKAQGGWEVVQ